MMLYFTVYNQSLKVILLQFCSCECVFSQEAVGDTLAELWISYNLIEKLKGINSMKKLKVLYMSNNLVKDWGALRFKLRLWN